MNVYDSNLIGGMLEKRGMGRPAKRRRRTS